MIQAYRPETPTLIPCNIYNIEMVLLSFWQEVIHAVIKANGVQHLISMATSEHVIMQNEALVALAIASAIDIGMNQPTWALST